MKTLLNYLFSGLLLLFACISYAQPGIEINQGTSNNSTQQNGMLWVGNPSSTYLSIDNNEVQARSGVNPGTLYLNYFGGRLDLLGSSNTTGDLTVDGSGIYYDNSLNRVGIGTFTPDEKLEVVGGRIKLTSVSSAAKHLDLRTDGNANDITSYGANLFINADGGRDVIFSGAGEVGIGTTAPSAKLHVVGTIRASGELRLGTAERLVDGGSSTIHTNSNFSSTSHLVFDLGGSASANAWDDVYADNFVNVSDMREKENVSPATYGLAELMTINPIQYQLINDPQASVKLGLSAQELLPIMPEAVKTHDVQFDEEGNMSIIELERFGVTYNSLIPVLINAVKELKAEIDALKE